MSYADVEAYGRKHSLTTLKDDWERLLCPDAGHHLHWSCGICPVHGVPRFRGHPSMGSQTRCLLEVVPPRPTP